MEKSVAELEREGRVHEAQAYRTALLEWLDLEVQLHTRVKAVSGQMKSTTHPSGSGLSGSGSESPRHDAGTDTSTGAGGEGGGRGHGQRQDEGRSGGSGGTRTSGRGGSGLKKGFLFGAPRKKKGG